MTQNKRYRWLIVLSLVILGVIYYLPMFSIKGITVCDDTTFHLGRLVGLGNVWSSPVNFDNFGNNGMMVNIFYPWLTMYPMRIIYGITGSYVVSYKLYQTLLSIMTLLVAYFSMCGISKSRISGCIFAVLYTFSSYRYADIFNRDSLGEAIALTFLPLMLLGVYKICLDDYEEWRKLAAGMTLIAYSHMLSLCMAAGFVGVIYIITLAVQDRRGQRLASMVKAACLSVGMSLAMIVPMLEQYKKNELFTPEGSGDTLSGSAYSLGEVINFSIQNNPAGRGIGILALAAVMISIALLVFRFVSAHGRIETDERFAVLLMLVGVIIFFCTTDMLPWQRIGDSTPVSTLQFVWRLNAYPILAFTAAFSILVSKTAGSSRAGAVIVIAVIISSSIGIQCYNLYTQKGINTAKELITEEDIAVWPSGNVDYAPYKAKEYRDTNGKTMEYLYINGKEIEESPVTEENGSKYIQKIDASKEMRTVDIPVFRFYGQKVLLNGEPVESKMSARGTTEISVTEGETCTVEISYKYTLLAKASWIMSMAVFISAIISIIYKKGSGKRI